MEDRGYQQAVQVLQSRMGGRWEGAEPEGHDEMVRILKDELGYDDRRAKDTIDAMIETGTLRYHRAVGSTDPTFAVPAMPTGTGGSSTGVGAGAVVGVAGAPLGTPVSTGYWQIGDELGEAGRAGQVNVPGT